MRLPHSLSPLRHRDYRLIFFGSSLSNIGTWMHRIAVDWLMYQQTDSAAMVGLVTFAQFVPMAVIGPYAGVLADRIDRRRLLIGAQIFMMVTAATMTGLQFTGAASPLALVLVSLALGIGFAFAGPTWQSVIPQLVPRGELTRAIALNSSKRSAARIVGPALGGVLIVAVGAGGVFLLNTVSYVTAIWAMCQLRVAAAADAHHGRVRDDLRAGVRYTVTDRGIFWLVTGVVLLSLLATPLVTLLPVYARDVLGGNASTLGLLTGSLGAGSLLGSVLLGQFGDRLTPAALVGGSVMALSGTTAAVALAPGVALMAAAVLGSGLFRLGSIAATNTRIQARVLDSYRGRVMSLFMFGFGTAYPLGALVAGTLAETWGVRMVTGAMAVGIGLTGCLLWWKLARHAVTAPEPMPEAVRAA